MRGSVVGESMEADCVYGCGAKKALFASRSMGSRGGDISMSGDKEEIRRLGRLRRFRRMLAIG